MHINLKQKNLSSRNHPRHSAGFTLIELLVAVTILVILATITMTALNVTANNERVPGAARELQSFLIGARDRAIFRGRPVGVRLYLDSNGIQNGMSNRLTVNSLAYVGTPPFLTGFLNIREKFIVGPFPREDDKRSIQAPTDWDVIRQRRGLIDRTVTMQIEIRNPTTNAFSTYRMAWGDHGGDTGWKLTKKFEGSVLTGLPYRLTLLPAVLPNQPTRELPNGVAINLESSRVNQRIPSFWYVPENSALPPTVPNRLQPSDQGAYITYLDIMFTPSGTGYGAASGSGMVQLHVAAIQDIDRAAFPALSLGNPRNSDTERLVTVNPVTGNISVAQIPLFADADMDDLPDTVYDPYIFAELGKTAP